jgi:prevent-host-death family protein
MMSFSITEDFKTISDLKKKTNEIFKQIHQTGRPVIITINGKPNAVLIDVGTFERKIQALNLGALLLEAEDDIKKGFVRPARDFLEEIKNSGEI